MVYAGTFGTGILKAGPLLNKLNGICVFILLCFVCALSLHWSPMSDCKGLQPCDAVATSFCGSLVVS